MTRTSVNAVDKKHTDGFRSAQLLASWTLFADPVRNIIMVDMIEAGVLQDHLICVSQEGTIGVISLTQMEQYVRPQSISDYRRCADVQIVLDTCLAWTSAEDICERDRYLTRLRQR